MPEWGLLVTNHVQFFIVDHDTGRLVDFVMLGNLNCVCDLSARIRDPNDATGFSGLWSTNRHPGNLPQGILNQIDISLGNDGAATADW